MSLTQHALVNGRGTVPIQDWAWHRPAAVAYGLWDGLLFERTTTEHLTLSSWSMVVWNQVAAVFRGATLLGSVPDSMMQEVTARILALVDPDE